MYFQFQFLLIYFFLLDSLISIVLGLNDFSCYLILLTTLIIPLTLLTTESFLLSNFLFLLGWILIVAFSTSNLIIWYISFEAVVIPMIYLISKGSSSLLSRYRALYRFTLYTILGGLFLLVGLLILVISLGTWNYYGLILSNSLSYHIQLILFPLLTCSYLIKLPIIPFHIWLPKLSIGLN